MDRERLKREISELNNELANIGISISDVVAETPKDREEIADCRKVIKYLANRPEDVNELLISGELPVIKLINDLQVDRNTLIKSKKYIITLSIICSRRYNSILEAFGFEKGGK